MYAAARSKNLILRLRRESAPRSWIKTSDMTDSVYDSRVAELDYIVADQ